MPTVRLTFLLLISVFFGSVAHADAVGVFTETNGEVQILRGETYLAAAAGVEIQRDDIIKTGKGASVQLDMQDGSLLKLGPETRLALSDYRVDSNKNVVAAALDVLSGWIRFSVAKLKPEGTYKIHTPVLTIGIRGTEGTIEAQNEHGGLHLHEGVVDVTPVGDGSKIAESVRVSAGEFIQRKRGEPLAKHAQPPAEFHSQLPPSLQQRLLPRANELRERGVAPKMIRPITREEAKHILENHPHIHPQLPERFHRH